jgi:hypothetical protein
MMDKVCKSDVSRLSMFKCMQHSTYASKWGGCLGPKSKQVLLLFNEIFIVHPSPYCVKNCNMIKSLFNCVISKQSQLLRFTQHHGSMSMKCWWKVTGRRKTEVLGGKPVLVPPGLPQHLHWLSCIRTGAGAPQWQDLWLNVEPWNSPQYS